MKSEVDFHETMLEKKDFFEQLIPILPKNQPSPFLNLTSPEAHPPSLIKFLINYFSNIENNTSQSIANITSSHRRTVKNYDSKILSLETDNHSLTTLLSDLNQEIETLTHSLSIMSSNAEYMDTRHQILMATHENLKKSNWQEKYLQLKTESDGLT